MSKTFRHNVCQFYHNKRIEKRKMKLTSLLISTFLWEADARKKDELKYHLNFKVVIFILQRNKIYR